MTSERSIPSTCFICSASILILKTLYFPKRLKYMDEQRQKIMYSLDRLGQVANRLYEALQAKESDLKADAVIQRFEFTFELAWKTLKRVLLYEGEICTTPRQCLKAAYRIGLLDGEEPWLTMLEDRNLMAHIYDEQTALQIYRRVANYHPAFDRLLKDLSARYKQIDD